MGVACLFALFLVTRSDLVSVMEMQRIGCGRRALFLSVEFAFFESLQPRQEANGPKRFHVYVVYRSDHIIL
jgi:hypothetical protein